MTKMNKQKILVLVLVPVFHLDKASHLQPGNHLRLSPPFKENSLFPFHGLTYIMQMFYLFEIQLRSLFHGFPFFSEIQNTFSKNLRVPISQLVCFGEIPNVLCLG